MSPPTETAAQPLNDSTARRVLGAALLGLALWAAWRALPETRAALGGMGRGGPKPLAPAIMFWLGALALVFTLGAALAELRAWRRGRFADGTAALLRKALVAAVGAWLWTVFAQPELIFARPVVSLTLVVAAALFGLARLAAELPARAFPRVLRRALDLCCTSLCVAAVLAELALQVNARLDPSPLLALRRDDPNDVTLNAHRLEPGFVHLGQRANSGGYVDEEFFPERSLRHRVVAIGDSFSIGVVPHAFHFTTVAEEVLGDTEICNMGASGIGPRQYLWLLREEALPLAPDLVVVNLYAGNDLQEYEAPPPRRTWSMLYRRNVLLYLVSARLRALARERERRGTSVEQHATSLGQGLEQGLTRAEIARRLPHLERPDLEAPNYSAELFMQLEVERARLACGESGEAFARLEEVLEEICEAAGETPLAVLLIPDEFQVDDELWAQVLERAGGEPLERDRFQRRTSAFLAERGVPVLDLLDRLRAYPPWEDGRGHLYHLRDTHFNARGNRAAGLALAEFLRPLLP